MKKYLLLGLLIILAITVLAKNYLILPPTNNEKANIVQINESNFDAETASGVIVLDFYADWCGPCRALTPILESLADVKIGKVDVDSEQGLAAKYKVSGIPCLVFLKDGVEKSRLVGVQTKDKIQQTADDLKD